jgi:IS6 family transposase
MTEHRVTSVFAGFRFPPEVISVAVRWYLRYGLSYRDVEELLAERGITVDHLTVYRWIQRFTPEFIEAARLCSRRPVVRRRDVREGRRPMDLLVPGDRPARPGHRRHAVARRDLARGPAVLHPGAARGHDPGEVTTDRAPAYPRVLDELIPSALHTIERHANNPIKTDHERLKARLRPSCPA